LLRGLLFRGQLERELDQELRFHIETRADDLARTGLPRDEALRRARLELGSLETHKEDYRAARGLRLFDELRQDLLYALRSFRRNPGFTAVAVTTLALGIGANTLFFTVVESVLLRPLPYHEPERLAMVYSIGSFGSYKWDDGPLLDPDHLELRGLRALSGVAAFSGGEVTLLHADEPARIAGAQVTPGLFPLLGETPLLGRVFADGERGVALLGEALWRGRFQADPGVLGRSVTIEGEPHTIVGVLPARFAFPPKAQLWRPLELRPGYWANAMNRGIARLAPGVTHAQAQAQIETLLGNAARQAPENRRGPRRVRVVELRESLVGNVRTLLLVLLGVVAFVLLIGCANMANLLMARAGARAQEMAVRASLGASRARLLRQLLTESAALSALGGALGLLLVSAGLPALLGFVPANMLPRIEEVHVNGGVLGFTLLVSLFTGLLFGSAPALLLLRGAPGAHAQRPGASALGRERRLHGTLIVAETALVLVLLVGAGLLLRSFRRLQQVDPGFRREGLLTLSVWLPERGYASRRPSATSTSAAAAAAERCAARPGQRGQPAAVRLRGLARRLHGSKDATARRT
jgi:predicted permease